MDLKSIRFRIALWFECIIAKARIKSVSDQNLKHK